MPWLTVYIYDTLRTVLAANIVRWAGWPCRGSCTQKGVLVDNASMVCIECQAGACGSDVLCTILHCSTLCDTLPPCVQDKVVSTRVGLRAAGAAQPTSGPSSEICHRPAPLDWGVFRCSSPKSRCFISMRARLLPTLDSTNG